jgi:hypothetical protein
VIRGGSFSLDKISNSFFRSRRSFFVMTRPNSQGGNQMKTALNCLAVLAMTAPAIGFASTAKLPMAQDLEVQDSPTLILSEAIATHPHDLPAECSALTLDDGQKTQMKNAFFDFTKKKNTFEAQIRNAHLDLVHTFVDSASTKDDGTARMNDFKTAVDAMGGAMGDLALTINYDILKPEQRQPGYVCAMAIKKQHMMDKLKRMCDALPKPTPTPSPSPSPTP